MDLKNTLGQLIRHEDLFAIPLAACLSVSAACIMSTPITIAGAAIFGVTSYFLDRTITWIVNRVFESDSKFSSTISKVVIWMSSLLVTSAAAAAASSLLSATLTFKAAILLSAATGGLGLLVAIAIGAIIFVPRLYRQPIDAV